MARDLRTLPHPPWRVPLLGDILTASPTTPTQRETEWVPELGPIFERKLGPRRVVIAAGSELCEQMRDETLWGRALAGPSVKLRTLAPLGMFTAPTRSDAWSEAREVLTPGFAKASMRVYHDAMVGVVDRLLTAWRDVGAVAVPDAMTRLTVETIASAGFGYSTGDFATAPPDDPFLSALRRWLEWASQSSNQLPLVGDVRHPGQRRQLARDKAALQKTVTDIISARGERRPAAPDLLDLMLHSPVPDTGQPLPREVVRDNVLTFLIAGHETTASLLETSLYYLAADPVLAELVRDDVLSVCGDGPIAYGQVAKLRTVRSIVSETLRLWPPVPGYFRIARTDTELGGYAIPAGQVVLALVLAAQRDKGIWGTDAGEFKPQRFTSKPVGFYRPFGTGPRSCVGMQFALHEAALVLATLVRAHALSLLDGTELIVAERGGLRPKPYKIQLRPVLASELSSP